MTARSRSDDRKRTGDGEVTSARSKRDFISPSALRSDSESPSRASSLGLESSQHASGLSSERRLGTSCWKHCMCLQLEETKNKSGKKKKRRKEEEEEGWGTWRPDVSAGPVAASGWRSDTTSASQQLRSFQTTSGKSDSELCPVSLSRRRCTGSGSTPWHKGRSGCGGQMQTRLPLPL